MFLKLNGLPGYGALDGDEPMDFHSELMHFCGIIEPFEAREKNVDPTSEEDIRNILMQKQDEIYDWMRDYNWNNFSNPGLTQQVYIQALMQILLDYNIPISERGKKGAIPFIENDAWAEKVKERKEKMEELKNNI